ncbi:hypothetical protein [Nodularia sp. NIES-3585]|uniref:hypothetical protein n=1 Tax=Nodularia sp. NIES-3585 TaxID=1973477 RepID=UPI000B74B392|nr:hypothetical protein [Nodularia sp. NIES-3585]GAX36789.1 hypothetical protein NIES3585_28260 [Nodularia sp. NIES-3585]
MEATIIIQDINSGYLQDLTEDSLINSIFGGSEPTKDTSFLYDVGWAIGKGARWVYDLF